MPLYRTCPEHAWQSMSKSLTFDPKIVWYCPECERVEGIGYWLQKKDNTLVKSDYHGNVRK